MYVLIVPQTVEPPLPEVTHAPLVVSDYPTSSRRLLALYAYYRAWNMRSFPFLDQRILAFVPDTFREPFVRYTNLFYDRTVQAIERAFGSIGGYANRLDVCYDCRKLGSCKDICLLGLAGIPSRNMPTTELDRIRTVIANRESGRQEAPRDFSTNYYVLFGDLLEFHRYLRQESRARDLSVDVNNVPSDQEEWWVE